MNACMYECCWFPLCMMINCMFYFNAFPLSILFSVIKCIHMFMGHLARMVNVMVIASFRRSEAWGRDSMVSKQC